MELYQVIEDNCEQYEDNICYVIAVFEFKEDAEAYAAAKQAQCDNEYEEAKKQNQLLVDEYNVAKNNVSADSSEKWYAEDNRIYLELSLKYPLASIGDYPKHVFSVSDLTVLFNPTI